jgi:hypothetical protein
LFWFIIGSIFAYFGLSWFKNQRALCEVPRTSINPSLFILCKIFDETVVLVQTIRDTHLKNLQSLAPFPSQNTLS